jgi:chemotaxis protein CheD
MGGSLTIEAAGLTGLTHKVVVGIADLAVSNNPIVTLATHALGSCIGVAAYDPVARVGGLLHYMLPSSLIDPDKAKATPPMFGDTGIASLFRSAYELGAQKQRMLLSVAGGANVLDDNGFFNIGQRNYEVFQQISQTHGLRVQAEHVGGTVSRTLYLSVNSGQVRIRISGQREEIILC